MAFEKHFWLVRQAGRAFASVANLLLEVKMNLASECTTMYSTAFSPRRIVQRHAVEALPVACLYHSYQHAVIHLCPQSLCESLSVHLETVSHYPMLSQNPFQSCMDNRNYTSLPTLVTQCQHRILPVHPKTKHHYPLCHTPLFGLACTSPNPKRHHPLCHPSLFSLAFISRNKTP
eukprot:jgi/Botrbrau1/3802/Bobra.0183s0034.1